MRFATEVLPLLADAPDVAVEVIGDVADYREAGDSLQIGVSTSTVPGETDWFDLGVSVTVEGREVPFADVFMALASGEPHLLLPDGAYFSLDKPELQALRQLIEEARALQDRTGGPLRISRFQAGLWEELAALGVVERQAGRGGSRSPACCARPAHRHRAAREPVARSCGPTSARGSTGWLPVAPPARRDPRRRHGPRQDAADAGADLPRQARRPRPEPVPRRRADQRGGQLGGRGRPVRARPRGGDDHRHPAARGQDLDEVVAGADVVVTSYTLFRLDADAYAAVTWAGLLLDEAQFVKNHQSKIYQCARRLPAPFKLAITGTPMENNLMELWSLLSITAPGLFPSPTRFREHYARPIEKRTDPELLARLRRRIKPLVKRRTKEQVAADLPAKQEQVLEVELDPRHRRIYQRHLQRERQKVLGLLDDVDRNRFTILRSLTLLRQLSLHPALVEPEHAHLGASKIDALVEQLRDVVDGGHRALVFSQFTGFLARVRERLDAAGIEYTYLDGTTRNRPSVIRRFKDGAAPVFLISLKAGGFGLNLTEADYCFLLDPWWNPATEAQAIDRTHRIGQTRNVMVYRLIAKDTIEEKVLALAKRKAELFTGVMDDGAVFGSTLNADDIKALLA